MEWVEVTAKTVEEAQHVALDRLGVDIDDAEFEVLQQPSKGLFGLMRGEARVRARVRPTAVRPKRDRRERGARRERPGAPAPAAPQTRDDEQATVAVDARERSRDGRRPRNRAGQGAGQSGGQGRSERGNGSGSKQQKEHKVEHDSVETVDPAAVGAAAATFVEGLATALGADASTEVVADGTDLEVRLTGADLGLLIGPGGRTLSAVQDLARVAAQRRLGDHETRLKIDIAGYREKRRQALEKFTRTVAADVVASGVAKALEPMSSADRKVVHDTITEIDGVTSRSDGDDPARRVVISPA
ncbi:MAG TPA: RNA-binding cell elongation regulator Jag/EloR [Ilumatobacter sp.]|nr:RNA-binding cell elongation regulator Jag/EloR [Ilumatobacter sp.]